MLEKYKTLIDKREKIRAKISELSNQLEENNELYKLIEGNMRMNVCLSLFSIYSFFCSSFIIMNISNKNIEDLVTLEFFIPSCVFMFLFFISEFKLPTQKKYLIAYSMFFLCCVLFLYSSEPFILFIFYITVSLSSFFPVFFLFISSLEVFNNPDSFKKKMKIIFLKFEFEKMKELKEEKIEYQKKLSNEFCNIRDEITLVEKEIINNEKLISEILEQNENEISNYQSILEKYKNNRANISNEELKLELNKSFIGIENQ